MRLCNADGRADPALGVHLPPHQGQVQLRQQQLRVEAGEAGEEGEGRVGAGRQVGRVGGGRGEVQRRAREHARREEAGGAGLEAREAEADAEVAEGRQPGTGVHRGTTTQLPSGTA